MANKVLRPRATSLDGKKQHKYVVEDVLGFIPPPSNSQNQDYYIFRVEKTSFHSFLLTFCRMTSITLHFLKGTYMKLKLDKL